MTTKHLTFGQKGIDLTGGTLNIFAATLSAKNLDPSKPTRTDAYRNLVSGNINVSEIDGLDAIILWDVNGTDIYPKNDKRVVGGILPSDNLILDSTSDATKGCIIPYSSICMINAPEPTVFTPGSLYWNDADKTLDLQTDITDVTLQMGQEMHTRVRNDSGVDILNGQAVYISGALGANVPTIALAIANDPVKAQAIGLAIHDIANNSFGLVTISGVVRDFDTSAFFAGDEVYLSSSTLGGLTAISPKAPNYAMMMGTITISNVSIGEMLVSPNREKTTNHVTINNLGIVTGITDEFVTTAIPFSETGTTGLHTNFNSTSLVGAINENKETFMSTLEPTGFLDRSNVSITFTSATRTVSISPVATSFDVIVKSKLFTKTGLETVIITDVEGIHMFYYDITGTFLVNDIPTEDEIDEVIKNEGLAGFVYWDASNLIDVYFTGNNECHGCKMDGATHEYLHETEGSRYISGMGLNTMDVDGSGDDTTAAQFGMDTGKFYDEDITIDLSAILSIVGLPVFYLAGTSSAPLMRISLNPGYPVITAGTGRLAYNFLTGGNWTIAEVGNNDFVLAHVFAINDSVYPYAVLMGQSDYPTLSQARIGANNEVSSLQTAVSFAEFVVVATVIFQTSNGYANAVKGRVRSTDTGGDYIDWRVSNVTSGSTPSSHSLLTGLSSDDHLQYPLLTGRSGDSLSIDDIVGQSRNLSIMDYVDNTKKVLFDPSSISVSTTRTLTVQDQDGTIALLSDVAGGYWTRTGTVISPSTSGDTVLLDAPFEITRASTSARAVTYFKTGASYKWMLGTNETTVNENFYLYSYTKANNVLSVIESTGYVNIKYGMTANILNEFTPGSGVTIMNSKFEDYKLLVDVVGGDSGNLIIQDHTDNTKQLAFDQSLCTTGSYRVLKIPNSDGTIALTSDLHTNYLDRTGTVLSPVTSGDSLNVNEINEQTSASGVTVEGVILKDSIVYTPYIYEKTLAGGIVYTGQFHKFNSNSGLRAQVDSTGLLANVISELTTNSGVTIDGTLFKDNVITLTGVINTGIYLDRSSTLAYNGIVYQTATTWNIYMGHAASTNWGIYNGALSLYYFLVTTAGAIYLSTTVYSTLLTGARPLYIAGSGLIGYQVSLREAKTNINLCTLDQAKKIYDAPVYRYNFRNRNEDGTFSSTDFAPYYQIGPLADETYLYNPDAAVGDWERDENGNWVRVRDIGVNEKDHIGQLIVLSKHHNEEIDKLKNQVQGYIDQTAEIVSLKKDINTLNSRLSTLESVVTQYMSS